MKKLITGALTALTLGAGLLCAAPAQADSPAEYLVRVRVALPYIYKEYGDYKLLEEGAKICSMEASDTSAYDKVETVKHDLPMSDGSAESLVSIASVWMGC